MSATKFNGFEKYFIQTALRLSNKQKLLDATWKINTEILGKHRF